MAAPGTPDHLIQQLLDTVRAHMPEGLGEMGQDLRSNLRAVVAESLNHMDLIPRQEFEVQKKVLHRTRTKLEALEQRLAAIEAQIDPENA